MNLEGRKSRAPPEADFEIACWECDDPSAADVYVRVAKEPDDPMKSTRRWGQPICQSHLEELREDDDAEVRVLEDKSRTVRGRNHNASLETWGEQA
ncbi:hypothetical protein [Halostella litorea]|uniref:hypothetical protein n=1 Tax=Halostella litorea TaxID=2528831 RepID=UPI001092F74C|nr:hypothetical protein [Halostella litorea]